MVERLRATQEETRAAGTSIIPTRYTRAPAHAFIHSRSHSRSHSRIHSRSHSPTRPQVLLRDLKGRKELEDMPLFKMARLSVQTVPPAAWTYICGSMNKEELEEFM